MKKKQTYNPLINEDSDFVSPNRRTYKQLLAGGLKTERVGATPVTNPTKAEFSVFKKDVARNYGSQTGKLKKKHIFREKQHLFSIGLSHQLDNDETGATVNETIKLGKQILNGDINE